MPSDLTQLTGAEAFTTPRLRARRWRPSDLGPLLRVYGDADAMRWVGDGSPLSRDEAERWLEVTAANYARRGYGMFALEDLATGEVVGFVGIVHPGGQEEPEVKYAFARERWGQGLATEAVRGVVAYGAATHGLTRVIATTAPENSASHRVLEKAGFARGELRPNDDGSFTQLFEWTAGPDRS
ncbi:MAG TPA: GNAT family N-acetyltransferase [Trueperaceae bacterium]|nr:GNAT family N-acetyltransferase [Trueperaceae bacterium]